MPQKPINFKHSFTRRCHNHNYRAPFIYHIILSKADSCEPFGFVKGDARIPPGTPGCAYIELSNLGKIIEKALKELGNEQEIIQIYQYCIMPDHVHILLRVTDWSEMHLGFYITALKGKARESYNSLTGSELSSKDIFKPNYCDKPLTRRRSLDGLFRYIRENPHRLAMRRQYPQFFQRARNVQIGDRLCEAYGNLFLLRNPDKAAVKISRRDSPEAVAAKTARWLDEASRGTVLVSPFISPREKEVRAKAEARGACIILITHEAFPDRFKPSDHDFSLCCAGRLLILSLGHAPKTPLRREGCLAMNALAAEIAS